ncbi:MAG: LysM peptidoglycan-binding domain-containing protein [Caldilineales bacterium]|nr:LysM peptidoglycan-binding domain-containing protein [Caldilineales bacterium]
MFAIAVGLLVVLFLRPAPAAAEQADPRASSRCGSTYVVRRGDTLTKIAARCGVSVRTLRALNGRAALNLRPGTVLRLAATPAAPSPNVGSTSAPPANGGAQQLPTPPAPPQPTWDQTMAPPEQ